MRILATAAAAAFISLTAAPLAIAPIDVAAASTEQTAKDLVTMMGRDILRVYRDGDITAQQKSKEFARLFNTHFDLNPVARFVLGRHWRRASDDEKAQFLKQFHRYIINTYSARMGAYSGQDFAVTGSRPLNKRETVVNSEVRQPDGRVFKVDWRLLTRDGKTRVTDLVVEGVSMAVTHRSEFASVISRGGGKVTVLIERLKQQNEK